MTNSDSISLRNFYHIEKGVTTVDKDCMDKTYLWLQKLRGGYIPEHLKGKGEVWLQDPYYHACDTDGVLLYRTRETQDGKRVKEPVIKTRCLYKTGISTNDIPDDMMGQIDVSTVQEKDQCVHIHEVSPAYSSIIGNLVDWRGIQQQALDKESSEHDSLSNACATEELGLVPDSCSAGIELARRGIVRYLYGQFISTYLPVFLEQQLLSHKKKILFAKRDQEVVTQPEPKMESGQSDEMQVSSWVDVSKLLNKIPKRIWRKAGYVGYRNPHSMEQGLVRNGYIVDGMSRRVLNTRGVCLKQHNQIAVNDTLSTRYYE